MSGLENKKMDLELLLKNKKGQTLAKETIEIETKSKHKHHKRTFISNIDGSVQYYSVAPTSDKEYNVVRKLIKPFSK